MLFLPDDIAPRVWKLSIRPNDHPVVYVDKKIQDPAIWARTDPIFTGSVLPVIIEKIFNHIFKHSDPNGELDNEWMKDWMLWAELIMPGSILPAVEEEDEIEQWIEDLLDSFSLRFNLLDKLLKCVNLPQREAA